MLLQLKVGLAEEKQQSETSWDGHEALSLTDGNQQRTDLQWSALCNEKIGGGGRKRNPEAGITPLECFIREELSFVTNCLQERDEK